MNNPTIIALTGFVLAATITPGPNNIMVMTSVVNFGFRRTLPHLAGVSTGATVLIAAAGLGVAALFDTAPFLVSALKLCASLYLAWLAWKIARLTPFVETNASTQPLTFAQAVGFQCVNPKVWALGMSAVTVYAPENSILAVLIIAAMFGAIGLSCNMVWAVSGTVLQRVLSDGIRLQVFNMTMALLLVASILPVLFAF
jgi:threonine/homoserine/homoserine lactone efflux protein